MNATFQDIQQILANTIVMIDIATQNAETDVIATTMIRTSDLMNLVVA